MPLVLPVYLNYFFLIPQNVEKMKNGIPLTDDDRWSWLTSLANVTVKNVVVSENGPLTSKTTTIPALPFPPITVASCSALKLKYRQFLHHKIHDLNTTCKTLFIFLYPPSTNNANESLVTERIKNRSSTSSHYMKSDMVESQLSIMEIPEGQELIIKRVDDTSSYICLPICIQKHLAPLKIVNIIIDFLKTEGIVV